ncbi:uncharacterized protein LOC121985462 [Zingiber officinale]|uniref:uncharacterized protein LOC121985462 n=1 Tax=Zingiber officinale TaxID=94328 RepID=UPI001C4A798F|nr:uncharacterized protein LOC121985462 [Zingiber officinale]
MERDAIQAEKLAAMRRFGRLRQIGTLLRCLEVAAVALFLVSWSSARAPAAARLSADFLRRLGPILLSPRCVFLLGNAIVILLFAESRRPSPSSSSSSSSSDVYGEFLQIRGGGDGHFTCSLAPSPEEVIYEDKAVCIETPACGRSRSARMARRREANPEQRRADTNSELAEEDEKEVEAAEAEEFRRAVEAFIAKQTRFLREECQSTCSAGTPEHAVVLQ